MNEFQLKKLLTDKKEVEKRIKNYVKKDLVKKHSPKHDEVEGHKEKSERNLEFVKDTMKLGYFDWCITGCYYASYHAALALILSKGFSSKNHDATVCILIKEFYNKGVSEEEIMMVNKFFLDYQDLLFYVQSKNKREEATYSSNYKFDKTTVNGLRLKAMLFIGKIKDILKKGD